MAAECVPQFSLADVETGALGSRLAAERRWLGCCAPHPGCDRKDQTPVLERQDEVTRQYIHSEHCPFYEY